MAGLLENMDFPVKHWAPFRRRFPSPLPVVSSNLVIGKREWVRRTFPTCNFSLILRGGGKFRRKGRWFDVVAPCVLTQWPGEWLEYGPANGHETWDECYVIYDARTRPALERCGFIRADWPMWPMHDPSAVWGAVRELQRLAENPEPEHVADHFDRAWERALLETFAPPPETSRREILAAVETLRANLAAPADFARLARAAGLSLSTFRRQWQATLRVPPARYLRELRLREACQRLVASRESIKRIAQAVGYPDEFHFSRRFRAQVGLAPREYRRKFQLEPPDKR